MNRVKLKFFTYALFLIIPQILFGQLRLDTLGWIPPVDIPIYLSGNFAELRSGHFHSGIDIKTQGTEGHKIYAVQEGYVSRLKVSPFGYGKTIYIHHPDGYTSVYAHLKEFNIQIDKYVKEIQYKRESFAVDLFPEKGLLTVSQGDIIGLSGNSGSSSGPHLHFEIRDSRNAHPLNGLFLGYDIKDTIAPKMFYLYAYPQNKNSSVNQANHTKMLALKKVNGNYVLPGANSINASGKIGLGIKVNDYLNGSYNRCGVHQLMMYVDGELYFKEQFDEFSFAETRYINSLMDYRINKKYRRKLHRLIKDPNNNLSVYGKVVNNGIIEIDNHPRKVKIEAIDANGNTSALEFMVVPEEYKPNNVASKKSDFTIPWQNHFHLDTLGLSLSFPAKSFYDTLSMSFTVDTARLPGTFSHIYHLHDEYTPVHRYFNFTMACDNVADSLKEKLLIARKKDDNYYALGGVYKNGLMKAKTRSLGSYVVVMDTIKPTIKPVKVQKDSNDLTHTKRLSFIIDDDFSGIKSYRGTINDQWVLFDWDPKNNLITYDIDEYTPLEGIINLKIVVEDGRGNQTVFSKQYTRNQL